MITQTNLVETVQSMYAAFGRGDVAALLASLHPNVDWSINVDPAAPGAAVVPIFRRFRGAQDVAHFFGALGRDLEIHSFEPEEYLTGTNQVASRVTIDLTVRATKRRLQVESLHLFTFDEDSRLIRFREFSDTLAAVAAWDGIRAR